MRAVVLFILIKKCHCQTNNHPMLFRKSPGLHIQSSPACQCNRFTLKRALQLVTKRQSILSNTLSRSWHNLGIRSSPFIPTLAEHVRYLFQVVPGCRNQVSLRVPCLFRAAISKPQVRLPVVKRQNRCVPGRDQCRLVQRVQFR